MNTIKGDIRGQGIWSFVQLITYGRSLTQDNWLSTVRPFSLNGDKELDTSYPYDPDGGVLEADDSNAGYPDDDIHTV